MTDDIADSDNPARPALPPFQSLAAAHAACTANMVRIDEMTQRLAIPTDAHRALLEAHRRLVQAYNEDLPLILDKWIPSLTKSRDALFGGDAALDERIRRVNHDLAFFAEVLGTVVGHSNPALAQRLLAIQSLLSPDGTPLPERLYPPTPPRRDTRSEDGAG
jgi:hypothetical protein